MFSFRNSTYGPDGRGGGETQMSTAFMLLTNGTTLLIPSIRYRTDSRCAEN
jgi:hypothetical protein